MLRPFVRIGILTVALSLFPRPLVASPITIDFESLSDQVCRTRSLRV